MPAQSFRKSTLRDVALRARVSPTTVSRFVSGLETVCAPETAQRIRDAVAALHYTPNSLSRSLHERATRTIGVCMAGSFDFPEGAHNAFSERFWRGISRGADAENYSLLHYPAAVRLGSACDAFLDGRVDGLLFSTRARDPRPRTVIAAGMPVVLLFRSFDLLAGCGAVYVNEQDTVRLALSHLWELGHRRIAHLAGPVDPHTNEEPLGKFGPSDIALQRHDSYVAWMQARSAHDPALVASESAWLPRHAAAVVAAWRALPDPPTAVFCANDDLALGVIAAARATGWRVPDDLSVVGVDNTPFGQFVTPALTTVDVPMEAAGREAVCMLLRLMKEGVSAETRRLALPVTQLVVRETTAPPRARAS